MINFETKDMNLLYSILNLKLRDEFKDLDDFNLEKVINFIRQLKKDIEKEEKEKTEKI